MSEEVKLLGGWGSPFSRRVELALKLKGIPYEYIDEDVFDKSSLLLESNPIYKKIPVLIHGGKSIAESLIIIEYIDDKWGGYPLLPKDPFERAKARFLAKFIDEDCNDVVWKSCWSEGLEERKKYVEEWSRCLEVLENELEGKKFFGGDSINIVDIAANILTIWTDVIEEVIGVSVINEETSPKTWAWSREFLKCDIVEECVPHNVFMNLPNLDRTSNKPGPGTSSSET